MVVSKEGVTEIPARKVTSSAWLQGGHPLHLLDLLPPDPVPQTEATQQLRNPNSKASSGKHSKAHCESFEGGCEFSLWLAAVSAVRQKQVRWLLPLQSYLQAVVLPGPWSPGNLWGMALSLDRRTGAPPPQVFEVLHFLWTGAPQHEPSGRMHLEWWALLDNQLPCKGLLYTTTFSHSANQPAQAVGFPVSAVAQAATFAWFNLPSIYNHLKPCHEGKTTAVRGGHSEQGTVLKK